VGGGTDKLPMFWLVVLHGSVDLLYITIILQRPTCGKSTGWIQFSSVVFASKKQLQPQLSVTQSYKPITRT